MGEAGSAPGERGAVTYRQWVLIEAWARCPALAAHGLRLYPLSEEQSAWLAQFEELRAEHGWRGLLRKYIAGSLLATAALANQVWSLGAAAPPQEER